MLACRRLCRSFGSSSNGWLSAGRWLAGAVLVLAAFNLAFRVGNEMVQVWDESLFAITAGEMVDSGDWIGTTFLGALDYYNSKPPLHMWLVALSFTAFEPGLVSLRAAVDGGGMAHGWRCSCGGRAARSAAPPASSAALVLATCLRVPLRALGPVGQLRRALHAAGAAATVVTLWAARDHPWRRVWLGAIVGLVFMVKGMGILMPAIIIGGVELGGRRRWRSGSTAAVAAARRRRPALFVLVVAPWAVARWQVDGWRFFDAMFFHDFVERASTRARRARGRAVLLPLFPAEASLRLAAGRARRRDRACPARWTRVRTLIDGADRFTAVLLLRRGSPATFVLPSVVATKLGWYLNSFYPLFALVRRALVVVEAWRATAPHPRRAALVAASFVVALGVAEGKLAWHSYRLLDVRAIGAEPVSGARAGDRGPARLRHRLAARRSLRGADGRRALRHRARAWTRFSPRARPTICGWGRPDRRRAARAAGDDGPADAVSTSELRRVRGPQSTYYSSPRISRACAGVATGRPYSAQSAATRPTSSAFDAARRCLSHRTLSSRPVRQWPPISRHQRFTSI